MKSVKKDTKNPMELPNEEKIRTHGKKESYKFSEILGAHTIKQVEMKEKIKKEYLRRTKKLLETKLSFKNLIKGINTWALPLVSYLGAFLKGTREDLKQMEQRTRKWMTMKKALHPRDDINRLYVLRKERETGHQKQYWQFEDQQNGNNQKKKLGQENNSMDVLSD